MFLQRRAAVVLLAALCQLFAVGAGPDFNSDGKPDILWRNRSTGENYGWYMDGSTQTGGGPLDAVPVAAWDVAGVADFDADGKPDILWRNTATGENHVWYVAGAAQVGGAPMYPVGDLAWNIMPQIYPAAVGWKAGDLYDVDAVVGKLRYVPSTVEAGARLPRGLAGGFVQGSPVDEPCRSGDETQFTHTLTKSLAVMETEVTRQMWADLKAARPTLPADPTYTPYRAGMSNPVQQVTWYEAVLFADLLSAQRGLTPCYYADAGFTTPITAANYTSANCGSTQTSGMYPSLETVAWFWANSSTGTKPPGGKASNPWNLKDVHGNVFEWCWDWYSSAYPSGSATDYRGITGGSDRVLRGGSGYNYARICRSAYRSSTNPGYRNTLGGFRLARSLP